MSGFITKVDFSNNRQIKQYPKTETELSGTTVFGTVFSALTSGPDLTSSSTTNFTTGVTSTFSGNTGTTIFYFSNSKMFLGADSLSVITPSNSGFTQYVEPIFTAATSTTIDGNIVNLTYSGVSYNLDVISMNEISPNTYTGTLTSNLYEYSAGTLDYTGRTIWVDVQGISRTERLIIKNNPTIGYVLTCLDSEGMTSWGPPTSGESTLWSASTGTHSAVLKYSNSIASGILSLAHGSGCTASGLISYAEGVLTTASNSASHAEGYLTVASGLLSHSEGFQSKASGTTSHAEGRETIAGGTSSHAEGTKTIASGQDSHAEGSQTIASGSSSHGEGSLTIASGNNSHSEGNQTTASGNDSHAEGYLTTAIGGSSHVEGDRTTASGDSSHAEGRLTIASGISSHAEGYESTAIGDFSHAEGYQTTALSNESHAEGNQTIAGIRSHAEGDNSVATGDTSHAEGYYTTSIGFGSHSEGYYTRAIGSSSHVGGQSYFSTSPVISEGAASFNHSVTFKGYTSNTFGDYSVILGGKNNNTSAESAVVLGCNTKTGDKPYTTYVDNFYNFGNHYVNITEVTGNTYSIVDGDYIIHIICSSASTITIPTAQIINNRVFIIKDAIFSAFTNNITIETEGSELIEGQSNLIIDTDGDAYKLYCYNGNLFIS